MRDASASIATVRDASASNASSAPPSRHTPPRVTICDAATAAAESPRGASASLASTGASVRDPSASVKSSLRNASSSAPPAATLAERESAAQQEARRRRMRMLMGRKDDMDRPTRGSGGVSFASILRERSRILRNKKSAREFDSWGPPSRLALEERTSASSGGAVVGPRGASLTAMPSDSSSTVNSDVGVPGMPGSRENNGSLWTAVETARRRRQSSTGFADEILKEGWLLKEPSVERSESTLRRMVRSTRPLRRYFTLFRDRVEYFGQEHVKLRSSILSRAAPGQGVQRELGFVVDDFNRIQRVVEDTHAASVLREDDVVVSVDGQAVAGVPLSEVILEHSLKTTYSLVVIRRKGTIPLSAGICVHECTSSLQRINNLCKAFCIDLSGAQTQLMGPRGWKKRFVLICASVRERSSWMSTINAVVHGMFEDERPPAERLGEGLPGGSRRGVLDEIVEEAVRGARDDGALDAPPPREGDDTLNGVPEDYIVSLTSEDEDKSSDEGDGPPAAAATVVSARRCAELGPACRLSVASRSDAGHSAGDGSGSPGGASAAGRQSVAAVSRKSAHVDAVGSRSSCAETLPLGALSTRSAESGSDRFAFPSDRLTGSTASSQWSDAGEESGRLSEKGCLVGPGGGCGGDPDAAAAAAGAASVGAPGQTALAGVRQGMEAHASMLEAMRNPAAQLTERGQQRLRRLSTLLEPPDVLSEVGKQRLRRLSLATAASDKKIDVGAADARRRNSALVRRASFGADDGTSRLSTVSEGSSAGGETKWLPYGSTVSARRLTTITQ